MLTPTLHFDLDQNSAGEFVIKEKETGEEWCTVKSISKVSQIVKALEVQIRLDEIRLLS